ncbi:MAG: hypothetical protein N4A53_00480 [Pelagimonas sp.]|jgi:O-antigen/teichoic acid export membrane protein|nr:hypothetical protein [Pelagimonas sp.]
MKLLSGSETLRALRSAALLLLARGSGTVLTFLYTLLMVRVLTPEDFGNVSTIWSLAMILGSLTTLNLAPVALREIVKARGAGDDALAAGFVRFCGIGILWATPVALAIFAGVSYVSWPELAVDAPLGFALTGLGIVVMAFIRMGGAIGVALDRSVAAQTPRELVRPALCLLVLAVVWQGGLPFGLNAMLALYVLAELALLGVQTALLRKALSFVRDTPARIEGAGQWLLTALYLLPTRLLNEQMKVLLILVGSVFLAAPEVALVTVALSLAGPFNFAIAAVEMAFGAKLSNALNEGNRWKIYRFLSAAGAVKLALCGAGVAVVVFFLDGLLALFGKHYGGADHITMLLLAIPMTMALFGKADLPLLMHGHRKAILLVQGLSLLLLPSGALLGLYLPEADLLTWTCAGFLLSYTVGYAGLWLAARLLTGIDTSAPGAALAFMRIKRQG